MCPKDEQNSNSQSQSQRCKRVLGFDAKNKNILEPFICYLCDLILRYPHQLTCGHRYCRSCLDFEEGFNIKCRQCDETTLREQIISDRGCQRDMEKLNIICSLCEWTGIFKNYEDHLSTEHLNSSCKYCGEELYSVDSLNEHGSMCRMAPLDCPLKPYGCHAQFLRMNVQEHCLTEEHQRIILQRVIGKPPLSINDLYEQELPSPYTTTSNVSSNIDSKQLDKSLGFLVNGIQSLNDDSQRLFTESMHLQNTAQSLSEDYSKIKVAVQETSALLDAQKSNQQILEQSLASIQQQIDDLRNVSYDGTYIWKITNFQQVLANAKSERQTSIYSSPFYSSPNGYKMRARLYPYGDGNARRTHISLFFVLMRGDYDAILEFPFTFKVTFCLFDQTSQKRHIIDSFRPDIKSNSFQRPRSDMNIASGIPKFFPLQTVEQDNNPYVRDDTMLIKIMVDFANIPKTILPFTLSINPGLPTLIQREYTKQKVEKQAQGSLSSTSTTTSLNMK